MMMGANLVGFVVGMDGAQYLAYQLVSSWSGEFIPSRCTTLPFSFAHRHSFSVRRMCVSVLWRTAHVRVPVRPFAYVQIFADCFGRLGRKSYDGEYSVDANCFADGV